MARAGRRQRGWREWIVPLARAELTLREGYASLTAVGDAQRDIPLIVQLVENPRFDLPGIEIFSGATSLQTHDWIHILLGRGLLPRDEAFVLGFTMGSSNRVGAVEELVFTLIARYLYPGGYRFDEGDTEVYRDAVRLSHISDCRPLAEVDYAPMLDWPLGRIRRELGLEEDLLCAYYAIERRRYPDSAAARRLLG